MVCKFRAPTVTIYTIEVFKRLPKACNREVFKVVKERKLEALNKLKDWDVRAESEPWSMLENVAREEAKMEYKHWCYWKRFLGVKNQEKIG